MKIKSRLFDEASGSIGNITAANSQGGTYFKNKPNPSNPNTARQVAVRSGLSLANIAWLGLTVAIREFWATYGATCTKPNQTGHIVALNGWNAFSRAYVPLTQAGESTAPLLLARPAGDGYLGNAPVTLKGTDAEETIELVNDSATPVNVIVYRGRTTRETINNYGGSFQLEDYYTIPANGTQILSGDTTAGRSWIRIQNITADGQMSIGRILYVDK